MAYFNARLKASGNIFRNMSDRPTRKTASTGSRADQIEFFLARNLEHIFFRVLTCLMREARVFFLFFMHFNSRYKTSYTLV